MTHAVLLAIVLTLSSSKQRADSVRAETEVRETVIRHASDVRRCYTDEGLRRNPTLSGAVELEITILPTGTVDAAAVATTSLNGLGQHEVAGCLTTAARNWRFERGPYAVETVVFPFVFSPDQASAIWRVSAEEDED
jgi:outer membrane biosynthesis protein TonB